jgi:hypothetical protein
MATIPELEARLEALRAQRDSAVARVSYDGRSVEYRGTAEIARAIAELERELQALQGTAPVRAPASTASRSQRCHTGRHSWNTSVPCWSCSIRRRNSSLSEMATKMDATLEHLRIGAIKGQILDADGSAVIYDLFTEFGVTAHTEIDFDLDNASPAPGHQEEVPRHPAQDRGRARRPALRAHPMRSAAPTSSTT